MYHCDNVVMRSHRIDRVSFLLGLINASDEISSFYQSVGLTDIAIYPIDSAASFYIGFDGA